jgi:hypothetical protein
MPIVSLKSTTVDILQSYINYIRDTLSFQQRKELAILYSEQDHKQYTLLFDLFNNCC